MKEELALRAVEPDAAASPALAAVVPVVAAKAAKVMNQADGAQQWEAVVEVEQAGDSTKAAADVDGA